MNTKKQLILILISIAFSSTSNALTLGVTTNATGSGAPDSDTQTVSSGSTGVTSLSYSLSGYPDGQSYAVSQIDDTGRLAVGVVGVGDSFYADATAIYSQLFTNATSIAQTYNLDFLVTAGVVQFVNYYDDPSVNWGRSSYEAEITIGSNQLWFSSATVERLQSSSSTLTKSGVNLSGTYVSENPDNITRTSYAWDDFTDNISFLLNPGETQLFSYRMAVYSEGNIVCPQLGMATGPFGQTNECGVTINEATDASFIGDPFNFGNTPAAISNITITSAVPLPASIWLLGSGLIGLLGMSRCRT